MRPKIYISARANSVQPEGRPETYKEHLIRVYNRESTPVAPSAIVNQFGLKKNLNRKMLESYLVLSVCCNLLEQF
jgi:hypothetical protein